MTMADPLHGRLARALTAGHARDIAVTRVDPRVTPGQRHAPAAVMIAVTDRPRPGIILTQRAAHLRSHAGQVAFPGGRVDPDDADVIAAALREAEEEVALAREHVRIVGVTDSLRTFTGFEIIPVVGVIPPGLPLAPHEHEVASVFEVPLDFLLSPANHVPGTIDSGGRALQYVEMWWEGYRIWGITAAIIVNLARRLGHDFGTA